MITYSGKRGEENERLISMIEKIDWGLMILDEV